MQIIRTIVWVAITAVLVAFVAMNWERAPVNIWPLQNGYLYFEWPVGVIAIVFFVLGLTPMYLLHRAGQWRANRRISALQNSIQATTPPPMVATSTQLETPEQEKPAA